MSEMPKTKKLPKTDARIAQQELAATNAQGRRDSSMQAAIYDARYAELEVGMSERGFTKEQIDSIKASMIEFHAQLSHNIIPIKGIIGKLDTLIDLGFYEGENLLSRIAGAGHQY
jgi:hypothetical protein